MTGREAFIKSGVYEMLKEESARPSHSYLVITGDGCTAEMCAETIVSFCEGREDVNSKDVYRLPFGDKVLTSDADFITETAYVMPTQFDKKYFIVKNVETATDDAQNKLLKTLEEPPSTSVLILLCANEYAMLPTVRSRCRIIRPQPYDDDTLLDVVKTEFPSCSNFSYAVAIAGGSLSKMRAAAQSGTTVFDEALKMLLCMKKSGDIAQYAAYLTAGKEKLPEFLDSLELILRDCMVFRSRPNLIKLKNNVMQIKELSSVYNQTVVIKEMPVILRARKRIAAAGNINSIVDELLFSLLEEKAKCQKL